MSILIRYIVLGLVAFSLVACGGGGGLFKKRNKTEPAITLGGPDAKGEERDTIWDLFSDKDDPNVTIAVNKYIWNAALDVLSFLPIEGADPFSGVIVMGWGKAAGSSRTYRATVYVQDAALDARSLRVAVMTRSGPASRDTVRAIEDAILTRARQMRIADGKL